MPQVPENMSEKTQQKPGRVKLAGATGRVQEASTYTQRHTHTEAVKLKRTRPTLKEENLDCTVVQG